MSRKDRDQQLLARAFEQMAREDVQDMQQCLADNPALRQQTERLYAANRAKMRRLLRAKERKPHATWLRVGAVAASLVLMLAGLSYLARPREDIVLHPQTAVPGRPSVLPSRPPTPNPTVLRETPAATGTPTPSPVPTATPSLVPTATPSPLPTATPSPAPTATPAAPPTSAPDATPDLPAWRGSYLPHVPAGYTLEAITQQDKVHQAVYRGEDGRQIVFTEYQEETIPAFEAGDAFSYHALDNGAMALVQQHAQGFTLTWDRGDRTLRLSMDTDWSRALAVANSVALASQQ